MSEETAMREKLARICVDSWDQKTLISFAIEQVYIFYKNNPDSFEEDCELFEQELKNE